MPILGESLSARRVVHDTKGITLSCSHPENMWALCIPDLRVRLLLVIRAWLRNGAAKWFTVIGDSYLLVTDFLSFVVNQLGDDGRFLEGDEVCANPAH